MKKADKIPAKDKAPKRRMGEGKPSNLPVEPFMIAVSRSHDKRGGIINNFASGIDKESGVEEMV